MYRVLLTLASIASQSRFARAEEAITADPAGPTTQTRVRMTRLLMEKKKKPETKEYKSLVHVVCSTAVTMRIEKLDQHTENRPESILQSFRLILPFLLSTNSKMAPEMFKKNRMKSEPYLILLHIFVCFQIEFSSRSK
jgi:hypothetical protein